LSPEISSARFVLFVFAMLDRIDRRRIADGQSASRDA
jgi:hypothetical protein